MAIDTSAQKDWLAVADLNEIERAMRYADPLTRLPSLELALLGRAPYPNAILVGATEIAGGILSLALRGLRRPIVQWDPTTLRDVPLPPHGTLVIWNLETLTAQQQRQLLDATTEERRATQIISVAPPAFFALVARGDFCEALYYRLNTVCVDVDVEARPSPLSR